jgi:hypothetical protein
MPLQCRYGYSKNALPAGTYRRHCSKCCYHRGRKHLYCDACRCASAYTRKGKRCKGPWQFKLPHMCMGVAYKHNQLGCQGYYKSGGGRSYGG